MKSQYMQFVPITIGFILSVLCIFFLSAFVSILDLDPEAILDTIENWQEIIPYLIFGIVSGFTGIPLFLIGLSKIEAASNKSIQPSAEAPND